MRRKALMLGLLFGIFPIASVYAGPQKLALDLHGFGHVQYDVEQVNLDGPGGKDTSNNFANGGVDLFITSQLSDRFSFLNETVFEFTDEGESTLDVERLLLKFSQSEQFNLAAGRGHTALGYWNQRFHHGTWLQTTTDRPIIYLFEDDGGILPVHFVGLEASGALADGQLAYTANVANGRGKITDEVQLTTDANNSKMVSLMLTYQPEAVEDFGVGANIVWDRIPSDPATPGRASQIDELIYGFHIYYTGYPWELIGEIQFVNHDDDAAGTFDHYGAYAQIAYSIDSWKPYYRYDRLSIESGDPFFTGLPGVEDSDQHTVGIRWDLEAYVALKFEYRFLDTDSEESHAGTVQASFAF
ncbi:MAG: hypothetical protein D6808_03660 [Candidatus Dadabacteria bacterium]|nr:MAG: hypothetical protein D6808_03660 [Candidatus Dadabacteria bacterium]